MNKKIKVIVLLLTLTLFLIPASFALYKNYKGGSGTATLASWNITLEQSGVNNNLTVVPEISNATYTLNVKGLADVDIEYDIVLSGLPTGIEASLDGVTFEQSSSGTITFTDAGSILYNANNKTNSHTITLRGTSSATIVSNQVVTVNVIANQIMSS